MRLAVFADGTWNTMDHTEKDTNVVRLCEATPNDRGRGQITFYDPGVGTHWYDRLLGGAFGVGLSQNIKDCYDFIVREWSGYDEIFLFGFSRGAYTVRSLAGLMNFAGIVRDPGDERARAELIDTAYDLYRDARSIAPRDGGPVDQERRAEYEAFCAANTRDREPRAPITFIGVWDTVGAFGIPQNWINEKLNPFQHEFHDTSLGSNVRHACHAVSIDEKRKAFQPTLWDEDPRATQVYFAGVHSDVGGGYEDDHRLATITLHWMAKHAQDHGLEVDTAKLPPLDDGCYCGVRHESRAAAWKLVRRYVREIPHPSRIHPDVRRRLDEGPGKFDPHPYRPENLLDPWERYRWD